MVDVGPLAYSVVETARLLGLSRNGTYEAIATGQLPAMRVGRRLLVPRTALERLLIQAGKEPSPQ